MLKKIISLVLSAVLMCSVVLPINAAEWDAYERDSEDENVTLIVELSDEPIIVSHKDDIRQKISTQNDETVLLEKSMIAKQNKVCSSITANIEPEAEKGFNYTYVFNGFSVNAKKSRIEEIKKLDGVKNVYISKTHKAPEPMLSESDAYTGTPYAYDVGYKGENRVVAVIDSEFDTSHKFFSDSPENPRYSQSDIGNILSKNQFPKEITADQVYKSEKIPFAYDYGEKDSDTRSSKSIHGSHVAGIVGGKNGTDPYGDTFSGVAPEAQLVLMKITDQNGNLTDHATLAATEDAVKLNVDAINMSFGSDYVMSVQQVNFDTILQNVKNAGISVFAAAGNASRGYNNTTPETSQIDYSSLGSPADSGGVTSVASLDNNKKATWTTGSLTFSDGTSVSYVNAGTGNSFSTLANSTYYYADCKNGNAEDFENVSLSGKIAVIRRGILFTDMESRALEAGAAGIIIINKADTYHNNIAISKLPAAFVKSSSEAAFVNDSAKEITVGSLNGSEITIEPGGKMSSYTSWGVTDTLDLTPEITAPGGNIYSSVPDNKYAYYSGTSMAAPHMTGIMALLYQFYDTNPFTQRFNGLTGAEKVQFLENLIMSNADIVTTDNDLPASPRQQGAGECNIERSINAKTIMVGADGNAKLSLKQLADENVPISFTVQNLTNEPVSYDLSVDLLTDDYETKNGKNYVAGMRSLSAVSSTLPKTITVPANGDYSVNGTITLDKTELDENLEIFTNGFFVDGFIKLQNPSDGSVQNSMPFFGFYGNWFSQNGFDKSYYDEGGSTLINTESNYYRGTFLGAVNSDETKLYKLGIYNNSLTGSKSNIAYSQNAMSELLFVFQPYRSFSSMKYIIRNSDNKPVIGGRILGDFVKFLPTKIPIQSIQSLENNKDYEITFSAQYYGTTDENVFHDTISFPIRIDNDNPEITSAVIDQEKGTLAVKGNDNYSLKNFRIAYTDSSGNTKSVSLPAEKTGEAYEAVFDISSITNKASINLSAVDYAENTASKSLTDALSKIAAAPKYLICETDGMFTNFNISNNEQSTFDTTLFLAFYDESENMTAATLQDKKLAPGNNSVSFYIKADLTAAASMKLFIWSKTGSLIPIDSAKYFVCSEYRQQ